MTRHPLPVPWEVTAPLHFTEGCGLLLRHLFLRVAFLEEWALVVGKDQLERKKVKEKDLESINPRVMYFLGQ